MKYSIYINQKKAVEWKLTSSEAIVFSWIYELASWADKMEYKGKTYYYGSKNKACEELPIISDKRDTMYRLFKSLKGKGLVDLITLDKSDYLALTKKGKEWYDNKDSEKNPSFGNKSKETESNPTDNNTREEKDNIKESTNVDKKDEIDFDIVLSKWSEYCPMLSKPRMIDNKRKKMIISLLKNNEATIDDMFKCFKIMANSQVCNGDGGTWKASFDWFIKNTNSCFNGLLEGKYSFKGNDNVKYKKIMDGEDMNTDSTTTENNVIEINGKIYK